MSQHFEYLFQRAVQVDARALCVLREQLCFQLKETLAENPVHSFTPEDDAALPLGDICLIKKDKERDEKLEERGSQMIKEVVVVSLACEDAEKDEDDEAGDESMKKGQPQDQLSEEEKPENRDDDRASKGILRIIDHRDNDQKGSTGEDEEGGHDV